MNRRDFIAVLGALSASLGGCQETPSPSLSDLENFLNQMLKDFGLPGLSLAVTSSRELIHSAGYGFADIEVQTRMSADTLLNIGSVSKTVTATAAMQLWEQGAFTLDQDVGEFLDFPVRNPAHPDVGITFRQILAHRSSITDGPAYAASYKCGDPEVSLAHWIEGFFTPQGQFWSPGNFHVWSPGTPSPPQRPRPYSNVAYGLLARLVEVITGQDFDRVCREKIFDPLGMGDTHWFLKDLDPSRHAIPYTHLGEDFEIPEGGNLRGMLPQSGLDAATLKPGELFPHCLYSFYNYPDGLLRSSARELAVFLRAVMLAYEKREETILKPDTVQMMLSNQHFDQALCWSQREVKPGPAFWGHSGGDPGISTYIGFQPEEDIGMVVLFNSGSPAAAHDRVLYQVLEEFQ